MAQKPLWVVRAEVGGRYFEDFRSGSAVAIGWPELGNLSGFNSRKAIIDALQKHYPAGKPAQLAMAAGQMYRFVHDIKVGDRILTYSPSTRTYLVGTILSAYEYCPTFLDGDPNVRRVTWEGVVHRDELSVAARNSLGSIATLFLVPPEAAKEVLSKLNAVSTENEIAPAKVDERDGEQVEDIYKDIQAKAVEFIKDKVNRLDWDDMQELVAGLLRAMGYKTRISPSGSDRGKDIVASPDGLGLEDPRIVVEVKHRSQPMGSQEIRSFLGGRHDGDRGLYVSTGGFTKDARYEAERARIPLTLMDLDDLVRSIVNHYGNMDTDAQRLVPLRKLYWPG